MPQDITLDSIIRRNLAKRKLPLHYYSPVLVIAKEGLNEMHFNTLQKVKIVTLTLDASLMTADLPVDYVEAVFVGLETGDKVRPIGDNHRINKISDGGTPFEADADLYVSGTSYATGGHALESHFNEYGAYNGRNFGRPVTFTDSYTILRDLGKIRIDHKSDATEVQLTYLTKPEKVTNKSVIHPFAQQSLNNWIDWQWAIYNKEQDQEMRRRDFFNSYRLLRGMLNKLTTVEIKRTIRNKINLAIKN
jgi:hypothetical protein